MWTGEPTNSLHPLPSSGDTGLASASQGNGTRKRREREKGGGWGGGTARNVLINKKKRGRKAAGVVKEQRGMPSFRDGERKKGAGQYMFVK